jgi:ABC-type bacteriocin/lantibiotic exporter with double-glycine peptidase domain
MPNLKSYFKSIGAIKVNFKLLFQFFKFLFPYRRRWLFAFVLSASANLLTVISPYVMKLIIDKAIGNKDIKVLVFLVIVGSFIFIFGDLAVKFSQFLERHIRAKINFSLNKRVLRHLQRLEFSYFQNKSSGDHLYRISYDTERVIDFITTTLPQSLYIFPKLILIFGIIFYLNWKIAFMSLISTLFLYLPTVYFAAKRKKMWREWIEHFEGIFKKLQEFFSHIQLIKAFGRETESVRGYLKSLIANIRIKLKNLRLGLFSSFVIGFIGRVIMGFIIFYGGYEVINNQMTLGSFAAIMIYIGQLVALQVGFSHSFQEISLGLVSCRRIANILNTTSLPVSKGISGVIKKGEIVFEGVSFSYNSTLILNNINFTIKSGGHIALVGPSGCGKTTLLNLILKLYIPSKGNIYIDGYNINNINTGYLRSQVAVVLQEPFLFNNTVENNIKFASPAARKEEIIRVAELCDVHKDIEKMPKKYKTIIGENGCRISEGQKQKIAIARALLKKAKILILDEAFSFIDYESAAKIMDNIKNSFKDTTLIVVTHRVPIMLKADYVYVLKSGSITNIFKSQELLNNKVSSLIQHFL